MRGNTLFNLASKSVNNFLNNGPILTFCPTLHHKSASNSLNNGPVLKIQLGPEVESEGTNFCLLLMFANLLKPRNSRTLVACEDLLIYSIHIGLQN